jgi:hypothetical protein
MIKSTELIDKVNQVLQKYYPIKKTFNNINELSHFWITNIVKCNYYFPFYLDIESDKIDKVFTTKYMSYKSYIKLYLSFIHPSSLVTNFINQESKIDILHINSIIMKNGTTIDIKYKYKDIKYKYKESINNIQKPINKIDKDNHFYFSSFSINDNKDEIQTELLRLFANRDKYKSIYFHLDNNSGGDNVPVHLILRCLTGKKEKWMKNIKKMLTNKNIIEWNCWNEDKKGVNNYELVQMLNLGDIPVYDNKYQGKIHLYMSNDNGSAAWYFITYLIYAFGSEIKRYNVKNKKVGTISKDSQLILHGTSNTTSGDGNTVNILYKNINIYCPTEQYLSCSIIKKDWCRFWTE